MATREEWDASYANKPLVWSAGPNALFASELKQLAPGTALDIACGEGRNALWLAEQGWDVTAIDFSSAAIAKAQEIEKSRNFERPDSDQLNVHWIAEDVASFPIRHSYDLVSVIFLHTDVETRERWFAKVIDSVAPGGTFIFIGHDPRNISEGTGGPQDERVLMSASEVCAYLADFDIVKGTVFERSVASDPGHGGSASGVALDTLVIARRRT